MFVVADVVVFVVVGGCCASEDWGIEPGNSSDIVISSRDSPDVIDIITRDIKPKVLHIIYKEQRL